MNRGRARWCDGKSVSRRFLACLSFTLWCVCSSCVLLSQGICARLSSSSAFGQSSPGLEPPRPSGSLSPSLSPSTSVTCDFSFSPRLPPPSPLHSERDCTFHQMRTWKQKWLIPRCSDWCQELSRQMSLPTRAGQTKWVSTSWWRLFHEILLHFKGGLLYAWGSPFLSLHKIRQRKKEQVRENEGAGGRNETMDSSLYN